MVTISHLAPRTECTCNMIVVICYGVTPLLTVLFVLYPVVPLVMPRQLNPVCNIHTSFAFMHSAATPAISGGMLLLCRVKHPWRHWILGPPLVCVLDLPLLSLVCGSFVCVLFAQALAACLGCAAPCMHIFSPCGLARWRAAYLAVQHLLAQALYAVQACCHGRLCSATSGQPLQALMQGEEGLGRVKSGLGTG
jgi:hypothetical protein